VLDARVGMIWVESGVGGAEELKAVRYVGGANRYD
jgi:hypothetical protein